MTSPPIQWHTTAKRATNAPEVLPTEWEQYRELLRQLYIEENRTLGQVMRYMSTQFGFSPSYVHNKTRRCVDDDLPSCQVSRLTGSRKRQYTLQFKHWRYFKNSSRHRLHRIHSDSAAPLSIPDIPSGRPTHGVGPRDIDHLPSAVISEREARPDIHLPIAGQSFPEIHPFIVESPTQPHLSAGTTLSTVTEYQDKVSAQGTAITIEDEIHPNKLSESLASLNLRVAPDDPKTRLLFVIDEEDLPTPSLSRTSRPSTDDSSGLDSTSLSSFGSGSNEVHLLMDVDDMATPQPRVIRRLDPNAETTVSPPPSSSEVHPPKLRMLACGSEELRGHGVDSKGKSPAPVFVQPAESTKSYSPSRVLSQIRQYRTEQSMTVSDFEQVRRIADFFCAVRSYADAFSLYQFVFDRMMAQRSKWSSAAVLRAAVDVTRTATSATHHLELAALMKSFMSKPEDFLWANSPEACLLLSHLGNNLRVRNDLEAAESNCRVGLDCYYKHHYPSLTGAVQIVLVTNLLQVLEERGHGVAAQAVRDCLLPDFLTHKNLTFGGAVNGVLSELLYWCHDAIADNDLQALSGLIHECSDDFWTKGSISDLREFETTLLFCHLWKQWCLAGEGFPLSTQYRDCHSLLAQLEKFLGIAPIDALAALSILIIGVAELEEYQYHLKSTLARRMLFSSQEACTKDRISLSSDFLHAHAAPLRTKFTLFSIDRYATLVQEFVQRFADLHLHLHLSETAFRHPGLRPKPNRSPSSSSQTSTMLSTPHSSWSGYTSFISLSRRAKISSLAVASDGQSIVSGVSRTTSSSSVRPQLSFSGSTRSLRFGPSNGSVNVETADLAMEDVA
jgi:Clr5 domain